MIVVTVGLALAVLVGLVLRARGKRASAAQAAAPGEAAPIPALYEVCWSRDPITGRRDRSGF